jgi:hypothetical protein
MNPLIHTELVALLIEIMMELAVKNLKSNVKGGRRRGKQLIHKLEVRKSLVKVLSDSLNYVF